MMATGLPPDPTPPHQRGREDSWVLEPDRLGLNPGSAFGLEQIALPVKGGW